MTVASGIGMKILLAAISLVPLITIADEQQLNPFTTDGCSNFPEGSFAQDTLWLDCCTTHDLAYWRGGTAQERLLADRELRICVSEHGQASIAAMMFAGVRVGGSPYFPTSFRWGYGWRYPRTYGALDETEQNAVDEQLSK
ncbi:MAG: hypothetical protein ACI9BW_000087 [Gammaproteobacteria bacterium]|jgi:hypothetical protein